jgi:hypothetical protein
MSFVSTARHIGGVPIISEAFHPVSDTAGNHAEKSIHITKLIEMSAVELFSFI